MVRRAADRRRRLSWIAAWWSPLVST